MSDQEQDYITARKKMSLAIEIFKQSPEIYDYLNAKAEVIKDYLAKHYDGLEFIVTPSYDWQTTPHDMRMHLSVDISAQSIERADLLRIYREVSYYLDQLERMGIAGLTEDERGKP